MSNLVPFQVGDRLEAEVRHALDSALKAFTPESSQRILLRFLNTVLDGHATNPGLEESIHDWAKKIETTYPKLRNILAEYSNLFLVTKYAAASQAKDETRVA